jgi:putative endonuclease
MPGTGPGMTSLGGWVALELNLKSVATPSWSGLSRPSTSCRLPRMAGWIYILTNRPNGILYVGVTSDLVRRIYEHRSGFVAGFTKRYGLKRLVYFEQFDDIREHNIKHWPRAWKVRKILAVNPDWDDLYETIAR